MRIKLSSLVLVSLISNNAVGDCYTDGYNAGLSSCLANCPVIPDRYQEGYSAGFSEGKARGYSEGYSKGFVDGREGIIVEGCDWTIRPYMIKEYSAILGNDLTLTLPILLNGNKEIMVSNHTKLKYYPKGLITSGTTPQGTHAFSVDSLGGNPLPNPSAKTTVRLLIVNGKFSSAITSTITNESNNSSTPTFSCNTTLNSCEMELNFGNGNENLSISTPQNATWLGDCTNTDLSKLCNIRLNKPYQTIALIFQ